MLQQPSNVQLHLSYDVSQLSDFEGSNKMSQLLIIVSEQQQSFSDNQISRNMYSQTPFPSFNNSYQPLNSKFNSQNPLKNSDIHQPTDSSKYYSKFQEHPFDGPASNPPHQINNERITQNPSSIVKNIEFTNHPSLLNFVVNGSTTQNTHKLPCKSEMSKSTILTDNDKFQPSFEDLSSKKQAFKYMQKRPPRMSQTLQDIPKGTFQRKEINHSVNQSNFYKNKQIDRNGQTSPSRKKQINRPVPSFLNRDKNDLKKSMMIEPTYQINKPQVTSKQFTPPLKKKININDFNQIKQLGNGKYGRVFLARQKYTGFICALKVIEKKLLHEQQITDQFTRQVKIQMFLNHPNIIKMYGCFDDPLNIYIILELGTGGQLYHQLKKSQALTEPRIAFIMKQICEATNQIHNLKIIHRDIKPENIVIHDNIIKLCDFGWSVYQDNKLRTTFCGTPLYVCPQILKGKEYDQKIDIWSIGIMMYEMVVGENPFKITREEELIKIVKDEIKIPSYLTISVEVRDFLDRCLQKNPAERASIKELMNHAFFKKNQEKNDKSKLINL